MADEKAPMEPNDESLKELEITEDDLECTDDLARYTTMCTTFRDTVIQFKETDIDRLYSRPVASITTEFKFAEEGVEAERREAERREAERREAERREAERREAERREAERREADMTQDRGKETK
ncbi:hypothetical protein [Streptomyces sp. SP2-10]|uniref:hypothetical protein n=1 Tax=Streptomyces sp. SP2-10 TaxID=2873385 RepID=UPI00223AAD48|nr:hypothetical protein [Streptomyces sp. SP2-10]